MSRKQMVKIQELHQSWQGSRGFRMILIFFTTFWTEVSNAIMHHCFNCFLSIQRLLLGKASWRWTERKSWNLDLDVCVCKAKARSCKHTCRRFPILAAYNRQNPEILTCIWRQWSIFLVNPHSPHFWWQNRLCQNWSVFAWNALVIGPWLLAVCIPDLRIQC